MKRIKPGISVEEYSKLKDSMWILRKYHECLIEEDKQKLASILQI